MNISKRQGGFTLVELAIVLVIIGIILGMAFKGKDLIDSARAKKAATQYDKIISAMHIYFERNGAMPGDGCSKANETVPGNCKGTKDGLIQNGPEQGAFWSLLIGTGILTQQERESVLGQPWTVWNSGTHPGLEPNVTYLDFEGGAQADPRVVCMWDRISDDGDGGKGRIRVLNGANRGAYTADQDCWDLKDVGQLNVHAKILP